MWSSGFHTHCECKKVIESFYSPIFHSEIHKSGLFASRRHKMTRILSDKKNCGRNFFGGGGWMGSPDVFIYSSWWFFGRLRRLLDMDQRYPDDPQVSSIRAGTVVKVAAMTCSCRRSDVRQVSWFIISSFSSYSSSSSFSSNINALVSQLMTSPSM